MPGQGAPESSVRSGRLGGPLGGWRLRQAGSPRAGGAAAGPDLDGSWTGTWEDPGDVPLRPSASIDVAAVEDGDTFGELAFVFDVPQPFSVVSARPSRVLVLNKAAWRRVLAADHVSNVAAIEDAVEGHWAAALARARADRRAHPDVAAALEEALQWVATERGERRLTVVGRLCKAAEAGDMTEMKRILATGHDPRAGDYDARTARSRAPAARGGVASAARPPGELTCVRRPFPQPLHVAAAKGQAASARFLLENGADANAVDSFGLTPLFEAVRETRLYVLFCVTKKPAGVEWLVRGLTRNKPARRSSGR